MSLDVSKGGLGNDVMIGLPQNRTEEILRDALHQQGIRPEYAITVEDVSTTGEKSTVVFADGSRDDYDWVFAADVDGSDPFDEGGVTVYVQGAGNSFVMVLPIERWRARVVSST